MFAGSNLCIWFGRPCSGTIRPGSAANAVNQLARVIREVETRCREARDRSPSLFVRFASTLTTAFTDNHGSAIGILAQPLPRRPQREWARERATHAAGAGRLHPRISSRQHLHLSVYIVLVQNEKGKMADPPTEIKSARMYCRNNTSAILT